MGYLPEAGEWAIEVELMGSNGTQSAGTKIIERPMGATHAKVPVVLQNTRIVGHVVKNDAPADAFVVAIREQRDGRRRRELSTTTDASGEFEVRGIEAGKVTLYAYDDSATSEPLSIEVVEDQEQPEHTLELRKLAVGESVSFSVQEKGDRTEINLAAD